MTPPRVRAWFFIMLGALAAPAHGADTQTQAHRRGESFEVEASAQLDVDPEVAWAVLTDYERLPEFIPGMQESKVVSRNGGHVLVDQRGTASLLFLSFPIEVRLDIEEMPFELVESHAVSGNFHDLSGTYRLEVRGERLHLRYHGRFTPAFDIPPFIGTMVVRHTLEQRFDAMVKEILRRQASLARPAVPESRS